MKNHKYLTLAAIAFSFSAICGCSLFASPNEIKNAAQRDLRSAVASGNEEIYQRGVDNIKNLSDDEVEMLTVANCSLLKTGTPARNNCSKAKKYAGDEMRDRKKNNTWHLAEVQAKQAAENDQKARATSGSLDGLDKKDVEFLSKYSWAGENFELTPADMISEMINNQRCYENLTSSSSVGDAARAKAYVVYKLTDGLNNDAPEYEFYLTPANKEKRKLISDILYGEAGKKAEADAKAHKDDLEHYRASSKQLDRVKVHPASDDAYILGMYSKAKLEKEIPYYNHGDRSYHAGDKVDYTDLCRMMDGNEVLTDNPHIAIPGAFERTNESMTEDQKSNIALDAKYLFKKDKCGDSDACKAYVLDQILEMRENQYISQGQVAENYFHVWEKVPADDTVFMTNEFKQYRAEIPAQLIAEMKVREVKTADEVKKLKEDERNKLWEKGKTPYSQYTIVKKDAEIEKVVKKYIANEAPGVKVKRVVVMHDWYVSAKNILDEPTQKKADVWLFVEDPNRKGGVLSYKSGASVTRDLESRGKFGKPVAHLNTVYVKRTDDPLLYDIVTDFK